MKFVEKDNLQAMAEGLVAGDCDGIIERKAHVDFLRTSAQCDPAFAELLEGLVLSQEDTVASGAAFMDVAVGVAGDSEVVRVLSHWLSQLVAQNHVNQQYHKWVLKDGDAECKEVQLEAEFSKQEEEDQLQQLSFTDMSGIFVITFLIAVGLAVYRGYQRCCRKYVHPRPTLKLFLIKNRMNSHGFRTSC